MKIRILPTPPFIGHPSGIDAGSEYEVTGEYEGFLFFYDEFGRPSSVHMRNEGRSFEVVK